MSFKCIAWRCRGDGAACRQPPSPRLPLSYNGNLKSASVLQRGPSYSSVLLGHPSPLASTRGAASKTCLRRAVREVTVCHYSLGSVMGWGGNAAGGEAGAEPELGTGRGALPSTSSIILVCAWLFPCLPTLFCTCQLLLPFGAFHLGPS